jgi:cysteine desulfurase
MREARVYLDYQSTTPIDNRVYEAMLPYLKDNFGNPSSRFHSYGWAAQEAVNRSRKLIASILNVQPREIIFTSGATESNNTAIRGVAEKYSDRGNHIITCGTEHKSVLSVCLYLEKQGFRTTYIPVNAEGLIDTDDLSRAITDSTILISLMAANNEIGVTHPLKEIGNIAKNHGIIFHSDATQAIGKMKLDVQELGVDLLTLSGHKIYGPKGIGILYIRSDKPHVHIKPLLYGGGQEGGIRSGTLNVPAIVGLAKAIELCDELSSEEVPKLRKLRDALVHGITENIQDISIHGSLEYRIPNNLNISFRGIEAQALLMMMDDIALSLGSACHEQSIEPSHVLRALHIPDDDLYSAVRFGLGRFTSDTDIAYTIDRLTETVNLLRSKNTSRTQTRNSIKA